MSNATTHPSIQSPFSIQNTYSSAYLACAEAMVSGTVRGIVVAYDRGHTISLIGG